MFIQNKDENIEIVNNCKSFIENNKKLHYNRLNARSVLVPADKKDVYYRNKEESVFLQSLNGMYDFLYQTDDTCPQFFKEDFDTSDWEQLDVPSMWQFRGYGKCTYPNVQYPIPFDPPYVDCENPIGYYKKVFNVKDKSQHTILHFGGVDNAFFVYLNGQLVGFSKGSRIPSEFDVSDLIREGNNTIAVKVYTYSDATYLENQDMLLANGIFRDVYLIHLGEVSVWDYRVTTTMESITVNITLNGKISENDKIALTLDEKRIELTAKSQVTYTFNLDNPKLWNAEQPNLYNFYIELISNGKVCEIHSKKIGIMHTRVENNKFFVNGSPITIKGINRHEYDHKNGRAISVSLIEKELRMIKNNNLNAIRCSHYTNNPAFYEIAAELGIYVMDEADLETHGAAVTGDQGYLSKNPDWMDAYMDRVSRMLLINKNEPCIFIWSMGNECGRGQNIIDCVKYTMEFDPTKVALHDQEESDLDLKSDVFEESDVIKRAGYLSVAQMDEYIEHQPIFMFAEYAHAMGNSPGFLEGYWDYIYSHDNFIGGFAWEFKSHGFYTEDKNGTPYHLYGGDFDDNEKYHWYNFCLDGYLTADGTPKPTWYELGEAVAPIYISDNKIFNTNDFKKLDYLKLSWTLCEDYNVLKSGELTLPAVLPHESINICDLDIDSKPERTTSGASYYLNMNFSDGEREVARRQIKLPNKTEKPKYIRDKSTLKVQEYLNTVSVFNDSFKVKFTDGLISYFENNGNVLLDKKMEICLFHAPTDNDGVYPLISWFPSWFLRYKGVWAKKRLNTMKFYCHNTEIMDESDGLKVKVCGKIIPTSDYLGFDIEIVYTVLQNGLILTEIECHPFGNIPDTLPRIGVSFAVDKDFSQAEWYGRGPGQNYCDAKLGTAIGLYKNNIKNMNFMFDMPQDTGNREDNSFVTVKNDQGKGISIIGCDSFSFSYHNFGLANLEAALHSNEVLESDENYLYIDYKTRGLGSRSCGPDPEEEFELRPHSFMFSFIVSPAMKDDKLLSMWRNDFGICTKQLSESKKKEEVEDLTPSLL